MLECECKEVSEQKQERSSKVVQIRGKKKYDFIREEIIRGNCYCLLNGEKKAFDGLLIRVVSDKPSGQEKYTRDFIERERDWKSRPHPFILNKL